MQRAYYSTDVAGVDLCGTRTVMCPTLAPDSFRLLVRIGSPPDGARGYRPKAFMPERARRQLGFLQLADLPPLIDSPPAAPSGSDAPRWILLGLLLVGLVLRLVHLGTGLWFDEIWTLIDQVRQPLGQIVTSYVSSNQHPLYSVLARVSVTLLGERGAALRLPAALLGTASLWAMYRLASAVTDRREALLGTALLTVSYHHVWFSQNARGYTGLLLFTLLATSAMLRLLREPRAGWGSAAAYGAFAALGAYMHPFAVLVVVAHAMVTAGLWWSARHTRARSLWRPAAGIALAAVFTLLLYAPMLVGAVTALTGSNPYDAETAWKSPVWMVLEMTRGLASGLPGGWLALAVAVAVVGAVVIAGMVSLWRAQATVLLLLVLPGIITGLVVVAMRHNLWPRFFFFSAGFAIIIALRGGFELNRLIFGERGRTVATAAAMLLILGSALTVPRAWQPKQDFEGAWNYVKGARGPADVVATVDLATFPFTEWLGADVAEIKQPNDLYAMERTHPRTWVLTIFPIRLRSVQPEVWQRLTAAYDTAKVFPGTLGGGAIVIMVSRSTPPVK
jgi:4-amino-4-deoxy-L-arabinose transferase-like glycosyltransferase